MLEATGLAAAVKYQAMYQRGDAALYALPNAARWVSGVEDVPEPERHLAGHEGHLTAFDPLDRVALEPEFAASVSLTGPPSEVAERTIRFTEMGMTELVYLTASPDIAREATQLTRAESLAGVPLTL